ncbi:unnamed protein product, partial [Chrysoparadoxa australica]
MEEVLEEFKSVGLKAEGLKQARALADPRAWDEFISEAYHESDWQGFGEVVEALITSLAKAKAWRELKTVAQHLADVLMGVHEGVSRNVAAMSMIRPALLEAALNLASSPDTPWRSQLTLMSMLSSL